ncbi:hypothetical protein AB0L30_31850 [Microbispora rosea]|uniref:hypothetical protein n=1 Tax=Microbispora rosea TaxID=58117 RepID=UPI0034388E1F
MTRVLVIGAGLGTMVNGPGSTLMPGRVRFGREPREAAAELVPGLPMPRSESYVRWVLLVPPDHPAATTPGREDSREPALELIDGRHPDLRDLVSALDDYRHDLLERGNAAVKAGKRAMHTFVPAAGAQ